MKSLMGSFGNQSLPSVIKNPFKKNKITEVWVRYSPKLFGKDGEWEADGKIEFRNGETTGTQKFNAPTFDEVVLKMRAVIKQLENGE